MVSDLSGDVDFVKGFNFPRSRDDQTPAQAMA
jgi:hypothetical protein